MAPELGQSVSKPAETGFMPSYERDQQVAAPRVLVVDDERAIRDILRDFLEMEGFDVTTADDGVTALHALENGRYDVLLSDLKMPNMGGLELLDRLKQSGRDVVTVLMTGFGTVESAIVAMKRGAFDYVLKPFKVEEVVQVLHRGVEQQRLKRENMELKETVHHYALAEALGGASKIANILEMICDLTFKETSADAVSLVLEDPQHPGTFLVDKTLTRSHRINPLDLAPDVPELMASFLAGKPVLFHGANPFAKNTKSFVSVPLRVRDVPIGMLNAYLFREDAQFSEGHRKTLAMLASRAAQAVDNARLFGNLQDTFSQTIRGLAHALEAKDKYTAGHSDRVADYAKCITKRMSLTPEVEELICQSALMHDIGKIGIRNEELNKPDKLTQKEYAMFKSHPGYGKHILEPITFLHDIIPGVYYHHEMFDGSGYPDGLKGMDIPLQARILSIADTYDAMCSDRAYRKALPHAIAREELARCAGRQFDPALIGFFLDGVEELREKRTAAGLTNPE